MHCFKISLHFELFNAANGLKAFFVFSAKAVSPNLELEQVLNWIHKVEISVEMGEKFLCFKYMGPQE